MAGAEKELEGTVAALGMVRQVADAVVQVERAVGKVAAVWEASRAVGETGKVVAAVASLAVVTAMDLMAERRAAAERQEDCPETVPLAAKAAAARVQAELG